MSYFRDHKYRLYEPMMRRRLENHKDSALFDSYFGMIGNGSLLRRLLYLDQKTYLPEDILYKVDIMSMANSLEVRVPLLDHKLVEFVASIPDKYKIRGNTGKAILKDLMEESLPRELLFRKKKGFEIPVSSWFRRELAKYIRELLNDSKILQESYFNHRYITKMVDEHQSGKQDCGPHLWILMALAIWHQKWNGFIA